ncbi:MAG: DNA N-6-adenine-methyltransferase [Desulfitobacteriaceae bacterium]
MTINQGLYSSATDQWETPKDLFDCLNAEFHFTLDVCALPENAKCKKYFSPEVDGLDQDWSKNICWMNPPYGREIGKWVYKASEESKKGATVVCLLPSRTDTAWWHRYIWDEYAGRHGDWRDGVKGRLLRGRLKFGGSKNSAPFPSAIVIFGERR